MSNNIQPWEEISSDAISLEAIKALHTPSGNYRISPASYAGGTKFTGSSRAGRVYVLSGACRYVFGSIELEIQQGQLADLPEGAYAFQTVGESNVELVRVFELPPEVRPLERL